MNTREKLERAVCCGASDLCEYEKGNRQSCSAEFCGDHVNAILDELIGIAVNGERPWLTSIRAGYG